MFLNIVPIIVYMEFYIHKHDPHDQADKCMYEEILNPRQFEVGMKMEHR